MLFQSHAQLIAEHDAGVRRSIVKEDHIHMLMDQIDILRSGGKYHTSCLVVDEKLAKLEAEKEQMNEYIEEFHAEDYVLFRREREEKNGVA